MIKIKTGKDAINFDGLMEMLDKQLPAYRLRKRGKHVIVAGKSALTGAVILRKKKHIIISGNFPVFYHSLIFALITVLTGILIPVILYFILLHGKLRKAEKEVGNSVKDVLAQVS